MKKLLLFGALAFGLNAFGQVPSYVPTNNLIAWYPFNGNTIDESTNNNDGTTYGGISLTDDRFGTSNTAQLFDGVPLTYIDCGNDPILDIQNNGNLTVSAWIYFDSTTLASNQDVIVAKNSSNTQNILGSYNLWMKSGVPKFTISNEGGVPQWYNTATGVDTLEVNKWYFLTGVIDNQNSEIRLYVNGILSGTSAWGGTIDSSPTGRLFIGAFYKSNFAQFYMYNFGGKIDDIGLWSRVLSQCEIIDLYTAGMLGAAEQNGAILNALQPDGTYQWLNCDNNYSIINGETNQSFTPAVTGNYAVEVTIAGCVDTSACFLVDYTGIEELIQSKKELVKIVDFMGRETEYKPNTPLIFIYSDGTRERVMKLEE